MKLVVSDAKTAKSYQKEVEKAKEGMLLGKKISDSVDGAVIGLEGYTLQITGGSDKDGFPMRPEIPGQRRVLAYISTGAGVRHVRKGTRNRRRISGNTISPTTMQVNTKVTAAGSKPLEEYGFVSQPKEKKEAAPAKAKKK